jgi:hypothetical protein
MALDGRHWAVGQAAGDDEHLAGAEPDVVAALQADSEPAGQDDEGLVGVVVLVPDELAEDLHELDMQVVDVADDLR